MFVQAIEELSNGWIEVANSKIMKQLQELKDKNLKLRDFGMPGAYYFAHLDPATSSHNYALLIAHRETYFDKETMKKLRDLISDLKDVCCAKEIEEGKEFRVEFI